MKNIDEMSIEMMNNGNLNKAMPPKLRYKFQKWLKSLTGGPDKQMDRRHIAHTIKTEICDKVLEHMSIKTLAKNEIMASTFNDGAVKFDFGSEVPEPIKKAAMAWAQKRGLKAVEASLAKSKDAIETVLFANNTNSARTCSSRVKWIAE